MLLNYFAGKCVVRHILVAKPVCLSVLLSDTFVAKSAKEVCQKRSLQPSPIRAGDEGFRASTSPAAQEPAPAAGKGTGKTSHAAEAHVVGKSDRAAKEANSASDTTSASSTVTAAKIDTENTK